MLDWKKHKLESRLPGEKDPLQEEMATLSSVLAWKILLTEELGRLQFMELVPSFHGNWMGKQWQQWLTLFFWAPKSLQMVTAAMKLKDTYSLEEKL